MQRNRPPYDGGVSVGSRPLVPSRLAPHGTARPPLVPHDAGDVVGPPHGHAPGSTVAAYIALTKPRIIELLLITTVPTMILARQGWPSTALVVLSLIHI